MSKKKEIKRILVTQPKPTHPKSPYYQLEEEYGVKIDFKPFFTIEPVSQRAFRDQKIDILEHTAVIFSSRTMMGHFFGLLKEMRIEPPEDLKYFCTTELLSTNLQKYISVRKRKVYYPEKTLSGVNNFTDLICKYPKEFYFIPTTEGSLHDDALAELDERHIAYTQAVLSRVEYATFTDKELSSYDLIVFFSPNAIEALYHNVPNYTQGTQLIGCLGEKNKLALQEHGLRVDVMSPTEEFPSITAAIEAKLQK